MKLVEGNRFQNAILRTEGNFIPRLCIWKVAGLRARNFQRKFRRSKRATTFI